MAAAWGLLSVSADFKSLSIEKAVLGCVFFEEQEELFVAQDS